MVGILTDLCVYDKLPVDTNLDQSFAQWEGPRIAALRKVTVSLGLAARRVESLSESESIKYGHEKAPKSIDQRVILTTLLNRTQSL